MNEDWTPIRGPADLEAIERVPLEERLPFDNTYDMFRAAAERHAERLAVRFVPGGTADEPSLDLTYRDFFRRVTQTANLFHALGIRPGRVVATLLPNLPQTYFSLWGGEAAGIACAINYYLEAEHIGALLRHARAEVLVIQGPSDLPIWPKLERIRALAPDVRVILRVGPGPDMDGVEDFDDAVARQPADRLVSGRRFRRDDIAAYFHTGGTTGVPKIVPLSHWNEVACTWVSVRAFGHSARDVVLCGMPLFHAGGIKVGGMFAHATGATVVLLGPVGFRNPETIKQFWRLVERYRGTYVPGPPTVYGALARTPIDADIRSLEFVQVSAAPSPLELFRAFKEHTGLDIHEAYGLTEATLVSSGNQRGVPPRPGSAGRRLPYVRQKAVILDSDGRYVRDCAVGEIGVLAIQGPTVFGGYLPPASNDRTWVAPGWLNSGDLGREDEDGYFWITGRQKELIIRGGHNIDPETIEEPLYRHPAVALAAAVGRPDAYAGEVPMAFVTLKPGASATAEELLDHARANIAERAAVPKEIVILETMPLTAVGKIAKTTLRNEAARRLFAELLAPLEADEARIAVAVESHPVHGALATVRVAGVPAARRAALAERIRATLAGFVLRHEIAWQD
ncbi:MAG TPA: acyl-CoA synthetase [Alphaproteobacteria bacterium]